MIVNITTQDVDAVDPDEIAEILCKANFYVAEVNVNDGERVWEDGGYVTGTWNGGRVCATCDQRVPDDDSHPAEWMCSNPACGIWFHVGGTEKCPRCGSKGLD